MKARIVFLIGSAALSGMLLASCGGSNHGAAPVQMPPSAPPSPPPTKDLDTAAVLAIVQSEAAETADPPFEVNNGAIAVTPAGDESSAPINVNAQ